MAARSRARARGRTALRPAAVAATACAAPALADRPAPPEALPPLMGPRAVARLETILGVNPRGAAMLRAESGMDMARFATAARGAAWSGGARATPPAPGNSAQAKRRKGLTAYGPAAPREPRAPSVPRARLWPRWSGAGRPVGGKAGRSSPSPPRRMVRGFSMLPRHAPSRALGASYVDERRRHATGDRLRSRSAPWGYRRPLAPGAAPAA